MKTNDTRRYCISPSASVHSVLEVIDKNKNGIALVVDETTGKLLGTITDGDVRRFTLANRSFDEPCRNLMWTKPTTAPVGTPPRALRDLMKHHCVRNIPLVDSRGVPRSVVHLSDLIPDGDGHQIAVIMAGGEGRRLRPITDKVPKPMIRVGDRPILENLVARLSECGVSHIYLAVNYGAEIIENHFEDGEKFGVEIRYLREREKLGTAGALSLLPEIPSGPMLVMNGDIVTNIPFHRLLDFHRQHRSVLSVASTEYHIKVPYGTLNLAGHFVLGVEEKPSQRLLCNAGIYAMSPEALRFVPADRPYNMTDLMADAVREGLPVAAFPIREYWVDVGQKEDLARAQNDFSNGKITVEKEENGQLLERQKGRRHRR